MPYPENLQEINNILSDEDLAKIRAQSGIPYLNAIAALATGSDAELLSERIRHLESENEILRKRVQLLIRKISKLAKLAGEIDAI